MLGVQISSVIGGVIDASLTGFGSATNVAQVQPGETVSIVGVGGIGMSALQGAVLSGAKHVIAIDPVEFKREQAIKFGATIGSQGRGVC